MVNVFLHIVRSGSAATTRLRSRDLSRTITSRVQTSTSARYPACWKNSRPFDKRVCNCSRTLRKRNGKDAERRMDRKSRHCHWGMALQATNCIMWMSCGRDISAAERVEQHSAAETLLTARSSRTGRHRPYLPGSPDCNHSKHARNSMSWDYLRHPACHDGPGSRCPLLRWSSYCTSLRQEVPCRQCPIPSACRGYSDCLHGHSLAPLFR